MRVWKARGSRSEGAYSMAIVRLCVNTRKSRSCGMNGGRAGECSNQRSLRLAQQPCLAGNLLVLLGRQDTHLAARGRIADRIGRVLIAAAVE